MDTPTPGPRAGGANGLPRSGSWRPSHVLPHSAALSQVSGQTNGPRAALAVSVGNQTVTQGAGWGHLLVLLDGTWLPSGSECPRHVCLCVERVTAPGAPYKLLANKHPAPLWAKPSTCLWAGPPAFLLQRCEGERPPVPTNGLGATCKSHAEKSISLLLTNCRWRCPDMQRDTLGWGL